MAAPPSPIETDRLRLVPWSDVYADQFADLCADAEAMRFISRGRPLPRATVDEILRRTREMWEQYGFGPWAALEKDSSRWVGRIGLNLLSDWPFAD
jgi:RimJ/RimL family protein N-acetyltransferase